MLETLDSKPHKRIGVAIIYNDQKQILIDRRPPHVNMGGFWEFPGGKIEKNETPEDCIKREILEELAITVLVGEHLMTIDHDYGEYSVSLIVHRCDYQGGVPMPLECDEIRWVTLAEINEFTFPQANNKIIAALIK